MVGEPIRLKAYRRIIRDMLLEERPRTCVEVGVYEGGLSEMLLEAGKEFLRSYTIVDSWAAGYESTGKTFTQADMDCVAKACKTMAERYPCADVWHMSSTQGAALTEDNSVDFWHTDGDHSLAGIKSDIESWLPKMRNGGLMTGDNYEIPTVAEGVKAMLPHHTIAGKGRIWVCRVQSDS